MTGILEPSVEYRHKTLQLAPFRFTKLLPISSIILIEDEGSFILSKEKVLFCYEVTRSALNAFLHHDYIKFDPLTTTTCCHGMSLLVCQILNENSEIDIIEVVKQLEDKCCLLKIKIMDLTDFSSFQNFCLPESVIQLAQLYILSVIKEIDHERGGWRTVVQKLKDIFPIGSKLCGELVKRLQIYFSNLVAGSYYDYFKSLQMDFFINDIPIKIWGEYIQPKYIRRDRRGRKYAACLYSMQITLAYLIQNRSIIAFANDLKCEKGVFKGRYIQMLEGDGYSDFRLFDIEHCEFNEVKNDKPIIIFAGCTHSNDLTLESFKFKICPWLSRFQSLVLACDTFYPQFPLVRDDPDFNSEPINPLENELRKVIDTHKNIIGVSAYEPSLFCLTHIYTASQKQVVQAIKGDNTILPASYIPQNKNHLSNLCSHQHRN